MDKYNIESLNKMRKAIYLEVETSVAKDIDCGFQWAINRIKQLEADLLKHNKGTNKVVAENHRLKDALREIKRECKKLAKTGWYDSGEFGMLKPKMAEIIIDVHNIVEKALEGKDV